MRELWIGCIVFEDNFRTRDGAIDMKEVACKIGPSKIQGVSWRASTNMAMITLAVSSPRSVELCQGHKRCKPCEFSKHQLIPRQPAPALPKLKVWGWKKTKRKGQSLYTTASSGLRSADWTQYKRSSALICAQKQCESILIFKDCSLASLVEFCWYQAEIMLWYSTQSHGWKKKLQEVAISDLGEEIGGTLLPKRYAISQCLNMGCKNGYQRSFKPRKAIIGTLSTSLDRYRQDARGYW